MIELFLAGLYLGHLDSHDGEPLDVFHLVLAICVADLHSDRVRVVDACVRQPFDHPVFRVGNVGTQHLEPKVRMHDPGGRVRDGPLHILAVRARLFRDRGHDRCEVATGLNVERREEGTYVFTVTTVKAHADSVAHGQGLGKRALLRVVHVTRGDQVSRYCAILSVHDRQVHNLAVSLHRNDPAAKEFQPRGAVESDHSVSGTACESKTGWPGKIVLAFHRSHESLDRDAQAFEELHISYLSMN